jgi:RNA recognition motif-containing protein
MATIYVRNINEDINVKLAKKMLHMIFNNFGKVVEVRATGGIKKRGQAWVSFEDAAAASEALEKRQGFNFFDKPLQLAIAKVKADVVSKVDGSFEAREKTGQRQRKRRRGSTKNTKQGDSGALNTVAASEAPTQPYHILFASALPLDCTSDALNAVFSGVIGFKEVRMVPGRGMAFVEFESILHAATALTMCQGTVVGEKKMVLNYSKA